MAYASRLYPRAEPRGFTLQVIKMSACGAHCSFLLQTVLAVQCNFEHSGKN